MSGNDMDTTMRVDDSDTTVQYYDMDTIVRVDDSDTTVQYYEMDTIVRVDDSDTTVQYYDMDTTVRVDDTDMTVQYYDMDTTVQVDDSDTDTTMRRCNCNICSSMNSNASHTQTVTDLPNDGEEYEEMNLRISDESLIDVENTISDSSVDVIEETNVGSETSTIDVGVEVDYTRIASEANAASAAPPAIFAEGEQWMPKSTCARTRLRHPIIDITESSMVYPSSQDTGAPLQHGATATGTSRNQSAARVTSEYKKKKVKLTRSGAYWKKKYVDLLKKVRHESKRWTNLVNQPSMTHIRAPRDPYSRR